MISSQITGLKLLENNIRFEESTTLIDFPGTGSKINYINYTTLDSNKFVNAAFINVP